MSDKKAPKAAQTTEATPSGVQPTMPRNRILVITEDNARNDMGDISALAEDIAINGLLEPVGVQIIENPELTEEQRKLLGVKASDKVPYVGRLVFGFRRMAAIDKNRKKDPDFYEDVPYVVVSGDNTDVAFANLNENIARKNLSPAELAERFSLLREEMKVSPETIAERVKTLSAPYIRGLISLKKKLTEKPWEAFKAGKLTYDVAREIAKAGDEDAQNAALEAALEVVDGQEGSKKKRGVRQAAAKSAEKTRESRGEGGGERSAVLRPGIKDLKAELEKRTEAAGEKPSNYDQGVLRTLEFCLGQRKRIPNLKPKG